MTKTPPEKTDGKRKRIPPVEHQFKPGNPGRPKGARNKLGEAFIEALHESFQAQGADCIQRVIDDKPDQYLKVIASLLPKEMHLNVNNTDDLTDEQLVERIRQLGQAIAPFLSGGIGGTDEITSGTQSKKQPPIVH